MEREANESIEKALLAAKIKELEEENRRARQIDEATKEKLKKTAEELKEAARREAEIKEKADAALNDNQFEMQKLKQKIALLEEASNLSNLNNNNNSDEMAMLRMRLVQAQSDLSKANDKASQYQAKLANVENHKSLLLNEAEENRKHMVFLQNELARLRRDEQHQADFVMEQLSDLEAQVERLEALRQEALRQQQTSGARIKSLQEQIQEMESRKAYLESARDGRSIDLDELATINNQLRALKQELAMLDGQRVDARYQVAEAADKVAVLRAQEAVLKRHAAAFAGSARSTDVDSLYDEERSNLESKIHFLNNTNLELKDSLAKARQQEQASKVEIQRLKTLNEKLTNDNNSLGHRGSMLQQRLKNMEILFIALLLMMLVLLLLILLLVLFQ